MPSRVIRGNISRSQSLRRVSMQAELTFDRLIVAVDDFGRLDADPDTLKADLFPCRSEATPAKVSKWVAELAAEGCVQLYSVDGRELLCLTAWEKHCGKSRRAKSSKYPDPLEKIESPGDPGKSQEIPGDPPGSRESRVEKRESRVVARNPSSPPPAPASWSLVLSDILIELLRPVPGARISRGARERWAKDIERMPGEIPELGALPGLAVRGATIEAGIRWALGPENLGREFEVVVRSGSALRTKWPKLVAASRRVGRKGIQLATFDAEIDDLVAKYTSAGGLLSVVPGGPPPGGSRRAVQSGSEAVSGEAPPARTGGIAS